MNSFKALDKLDNTLCLNSQQIEYNIDKEDNVDCNSVVEMIDCVDIVRDDLILLSFFKQVMEIKSITELPLRKPYHTTYEKKEYILKFKDGIVLDDKILKQMKELLEKSE